jgi:hypothetical protein
MPERTRKRMSIDNMRIGKRYFLKNYGEKTSFIVLETEGKDNFRVKDLLSLEIYFFNQLIEYGLGDDFELYEI